MAVMDVLIWRLTILLEVVILAGAWWRRAWISIPVFVGTIAFCAVQSIPLAIVLRHGSKLDYYYTYYAIDIATIAAYVLSAMQCWRYPRWRPISLTMMIYLLCKLPVYWLIHIGHRQVAGAYLGDLRFANLACYLVWAFMVWRYDVAVPTIPT